MQTLLMEQNKTDAILVAQSEEIKESKQQIDQLGKNSPPAQQEIPQMSIKPVNQIHVSAQQETTQLVSKHMNQIHVSDLTSADII